MVCNWLARHLTGSGAMPPATAQNGRTRLHRSPEAVMALGRLVACAMVTLLLIWAVAAGAYRALRHAGALVPVGGGGLRLDLTHQNPLTLLGGAILHAGGAFGAAALILIAAAMIGGAFGFLFGLPRMDGRGAAAAAAPPASEQPPGTPPARTEAQARATQERVAFRMSPALNEIADWLTKIIVGLGLVQARDIAAGFRDIMGWLLGPAGLDRYPIAGAVVPVSMLVGLIGGFIVVYLAMTLVVGREIADAALDLDAEAVRAKEAEAQAKAERERKEAVRREVVRQWSRDEVAEALRRPGGQKPVPDAEAQDFANLDFRELTTDNGRRAWINIQIALGNNQLAADAYKRWIASATGGATT